MFSDYIQDQPTPSSWLTHTNQVSFRNFEQNPTKEFTNRFQNYQDRSAHEFNKEHHVKHPTNRFQESISQQQKMQPNNHQKVPIEPFSLVNFNTFGVAKEDPRIRSGSQPELNIERVDYKNIHLYNRVQQQLNKTLKWRSIFGLLLYFAVEWFLMGVTSQILSGRTNRYIVVNFSGIHFSEVLYSFLVILFFRTLAVFMEYKALYSYPDFPSSANELFSRIFCGDITVIVYISAKLFLKYAIFIRVYYDLTFFIDSNQARFGLLFQVVIWIIDLFDQLLNFQETSYMSRTDVSKKTMSKNIINRLWRNGTKFGLAFFTSIALFLLGNFFKNSDQQSLNSIDTIWVVVFVLKLFTMQAFQTLLTQTYVWSIRFVVNAPFDKYIQKVNKFDDLVYLLKEVNQNDNKADFWSFKIKNDILSLWSAQMTIYKPHCFEPANAFDERSTKKIRNTKTVLLFLANELSLFNGCLEYKIANLENENRSFITSVWEGVRKDHRFSVLKKTDLVKQSLSFFNELLHLNKHYRTCESEMKNLYVVLETLKNNVEKCLAIWQMDKLINDSVLIYVELLWKIDWIVEKMDKKKNCNRIGMRAFYI